MKMNTRRLGPTTLTISRLCLGTSNFARYANQNESFGILDVFREAGGNFVQTSGICPGINLGDGFLGLPEEVLGRWLHQRQIRRDEMVIATRVALTRPIIGRLEAFERLIRQCAADSIRRIGCGYLDLLVVECTRAVVPLSECVPALEAVAGMETVRHVVPANFPPWLLQETLRHSRSEPRVFAGVQVDYSMLTRDPFQDCVIQACTRYELGVIARSPLAGGYLADRCLAHGIGVLRDHRRDDRLAAAAEEVWPHLAQMARVLGRSPAQVAIAWVLAHPQIDSVLVSVRSTEQLRELIGGTDFTLPEADVARLGGFGVPSDPPQFAIECKPAADAGLPE